ncbi:MAG: hypothetical protein GY821_09715 [Gammaproteobacteria bacterium]|nr:hypothetical protein [Gammaproteobacteria bacterium]
MNGHTNSKNHCRKLAEDQFDKTVEMLEALLKVAQPEEGGGDSREVESFRTLARNYIKNLNENRDKFISNPRKNSFTKIHNAQIKIIESAYQKAKKRKIEIRTGIAKRIINQNVLENHDYNKKEIIDTIKNNFLKDDHVKKLIIYDNTIKDSEKSILVGTKKEPEKNDAPGLIERWTGKIFSSKSKDEPVKLDFG